MNQVDDWRTIYEFWFPPGLDEADLETHRRMFHRWFGGGTDPELPRFSAVVEAAKRGRLDGWLAEPRGRLSLILVLDQVPRGLFAGTPEAYASDTEALRIAECGLRNGHYNALTRPWERTFFFMRWVTPRVLGIGSGSSGSRRWPRPSPWRLPIACGHFTGFPPARRAAISK